MNSHLYENKKVRPSSLRTSSDSDTRNTIGNIEKNRKNLEFRMERAGYFKRINKNEDYFVDTDDDEELDFIYCFKRVGALTAVERRYVQIFLAN